MQGALHVCQEDVSNAPKFVKAFDQRRIVAWTVHQHIPVWALNKIRTGSKRLFIRKAIVVQTIKVSQWNWKAGVDVLHLTLLHLVHMDQRPKYEQSESKYIKMEFYVGQDRSACMLARRSFAVSGCFVTAD